MGAYLSLQLKGKVRTAVSARKRGHTRVVTGGVSVIRCVELCHSVGAVHVPLLQPFFLSWCSRYPARPAAHALGRNFVFTPCWTAAPEKVESRLTMGLN